MGRLLIIHDSTLKSFIIPRGHLLSMKAAKDEVTGVRLYHDVCNRALYETNGGGPSPYYWCDKCQMELGCHSGEIRLGRFV